MGYQRPVKAYRLKFEDPDLAGLEVTVRSVAISEFLKMTELAGAADDPKVAAASAGEVFHVLAGALMEWNLDDAAGQPVPATYEGIISCELDFVMMIVNAWLSAMSDVSPPLLNGSSAGTTSALEQSMPMEPLSPVPPS
jgi:hypothetical protein